MGNSFHTVTLLSLGLFSLTLAACTHIAPVNDLPDGRYYMPQRESPQAHERYYREVLDPDQRFYHHQQPYHRYADQSDIVRDGRYDADEYRAARTTATSLINPVPTEIPLSPGDQLRVRIVEGDDFNGDYALNVDGNLQLPYLEPLPLAGLTLTEAERVVADALVEQGMFQPHFIQVSLLNLIWAPARVQVGGAVFQPGQVTINAREADDLAQQLAVVSGDLAMGRALVTALQAAGGVRPDADIGQIILKRGNKRWRIDLSGILYGASVPSVALVAGDQVWVPSTARFHPELVRPSAITPPGIRVFISNLAIPADSNSEAAINRDSTRLPYGTTLLQAMVSANCVGGTDSINSSRYVVLASTNPLTQHSEVIERRIEGLIRNASRDAFNPYLLPGDALACYDSHATDLRDIARTVSDLLLPLTLLRTLRQ